jgi:hypothetical protein
MDQSDVLKIERHLVNEKQPAEFTMRSGLDHVFFAERGAI